MFNYIITFLISKMVIILYQHLVSGLSNNIKHYNKNNGGIIYIYIHAKPNCPFCVCLNIGNNDSMLKRNMLMVDH